MVTRSSMIGLLMALLGAYVLLPDAASQDPAAIGQKVESAKAAAQALALYPKEVRDACLVVSQDAALVLKLNEAAGNPAQVQAALAGKSADMQASARVLLKYPKVLSIMAANMEVTTLVGGLYQADPQGTTKLLDTLGQILQATESQSTNDWATRMQENPAAMQQLLQAISDYSAYQQQAQATDTTGTTTGGTTTTGTTTGETATASGYVEPYYAEEDASYSAEEEGVTTSDDGSTQVYSGISDQLANYVLHNSDKYNQLADEVLKQYQTSGNLDSFNQGVEQWWQQYQGKVPADFLQQDGQRAQRLGELSRADKLARNQFKAQPGQGQPFDNLLKQQLGQNPLLKGTPGQAGPIPKLTQQPSPLGKTPPQGAPKFPFGDGPPKVGGNQPPFAKNPPKIGGTPPKIGGAQPKMPANRVMPNPSQQMARASSFHSGMFRGSKPNMKGPSMGGGPRIGGGRPGGGGPPGKK